MSGATKIEWCDATWSPVTGCTKVSAGCKHCYAERMATRFAGRGGFPADKPFAVTLHPERLDEPLHWRKPRRIFVCSMSDLFHEAVPDKFIANVWGAMRACHQHQFIVLTKRPARMLAWVKRCANGERLGWITHDGTSPARAYEGTGIIVGESDRWPLPNVWLGVSVEDQATAEERIPLLLQTPATVRFVSYEPALGPVDFSLVGNPLGPSGVVSPLTGLVPVDHGIFERRAKLDWIICGGESGPGARPMHPDWARSVRDQCKAAGVPYFHKQNGEWRFGIPSDDVWCKAKQHDWLDGANISYRVGKKRAGRLLDGREHNEWPEVGV